MLAELLPLACRASGTGAAEQTLAAESKIEAAARREGHGLGDLKSGRLLACSEGGLKFVWTPHRGRHRNALPLEGQTVDLDQRNAAGQKMRPSVREAASR